MPDDLLKPVARSQEVCKICGGRADLFGITDLNKNCEQYRQEVLPLSGVPIYYHRCSVCDFVFTTAFDSFTHEDFAKHIYNDEYHLVDPEFSGHRPQECANYLLEMFPNQRPANVLDYGGGDGSLGQALRTAGFTDVTVYDPFVPKNAQRPQGTFDLITCFEVLEHTPQPLQTLRDIVSMLRTPGLIVFSTVLRAGPALQQGINWWYIAPRNGHISIFSPQSLHRLMSACGLRCGLSPTSRHVAFREVPPFAQHLAMKAPG
jgi:2-polyprenyl-6-hydroxyphenyl methylase/3-demethylubiquinone-9 3-methyltransferase